MNSFYILLHNDILQDTGKLFKYFESCFPFVPATSYLPIMNSLPFLYINIYTSLLNGIKMRDVKPLMYWIFTKKK